MNGSEFTISADGMEIPSALRTWANLFDPRVPNRDGTLHGKITTDGLTLTKRDRHQLAFLMRCAADGYVFDDGDKAPSPPPLQDSSH